MRRKIAWILAAGSMVFALHAGFSMWRAERIAECWMQVGSASPLTQYLQRHDYLLGLSYALVGAFTIFAWLYAREQRCVGATGVLGGVTVAGVLYFGGCWLLGCCGSPLLPVYLSLFGSTFLGFTKPLILLVTVVSVALGMLWIVKRSKRGRGCGDPKCNPEADTGSGEPIQKIRAELADGMNLPKCQQCGCMKDTLEQLAGVLPSLKAQTAAPLVAEIRAWQQQMKPFKYACLGCAYCYPAVAMNVLHKEFPETEAVASSSCAFEVRPNTWPPVPGEYHEFCEGDTCPVAVSTLASPELADTLAQHRPRQLCIVGKTETENIGIDKLIKNTITNRTIRYLVVAGRDPEGHESGKTLLALAANGVDESMRVVGSPGKRPVLRNVTRNEVEEFRQQVEVVNMMGCVDAVQIVNRMVELAARGGSRAAFLPATISTAPLIQAQPPARIEMDKAGYFVIIPRRDKRVLVVEHYSYDNRLLRVIEGQDARSIYSTVIQNGWVTQLSHAAYLGKELARAELSIEHGFKYVQDGA
jgi:tetrahydromethanopterin S-methyltransferase subunit A